LKSGIELHKPERRESEQCDFIIFW